MTRLASSALTLIRRRRSVVAGLAFAAMCLPAASASAFQQSQDANAPAASAPSGTYQLPSNFRSDGATNNPARYVQPSRGPLPSNFRSDAADGYAHQTAPATVTVHEPNGFDWGDAGIGAASIVGLLAIAGGMTMLVLHHRRRSAGRLTFAR